MNSLVKALACGSGLLAVVVAASLSGCSSSDSNGATGGTGGTGGTSSGGTGGSTAGTSAAGSSAAGTHNGAAGASDGGTGGSLGAAGADTGTAGADTSAAGDTGAAGAGAEGSAVGKFCNEVAFGTVGNLMDITLRLDVGTAPNIVSFSALTNTCVPLTGPCSTIPVGAAVPVTLVDPASNDAVLDSGTLLVSDGKEYVFWADVGTDGPIINGGSIPAGGPTCSAFTIDDVPAN